MVDGSAGGILGLIPERTPGDVIAGIVRFNAGGQPIVLPVRSIADNEDWLREIGDAFAGLAGGLSAAGDDVGRLTSLLEGADDLLGFLYSYGSEYLPPRDELRRKIRPNELLLAVVQIWRAANPKADAALLALSLMIPGGSSELTSSLFTSGPDLGMSEDSERGSQMSSSSDSSMPPPNGALMARRAESKKPASARSSRRTSPPISVGAAVSTRSSRPNGHARQPTIR